MRKQLLKAKTEKASITEMMSFGGVQFALGIYMSFSSFYLMMFCTDVVMISAAATAVLLLFHRLFSVVTGQMVGMFINQKRFHGGKYRPYLKWLSVPFALGLAALGLTPQILEGGRILYIVFALILCELCWLVLHTSAMAMLPYLAREDVNRAKFISFSNSCAILAFIIIGTFMLPLANFFGGADRAKGFAITLVLFAFIAIPLLGNAYVRLKERHYDDIPQRPSIKDIYLAIGRNRKILLFFAGFGLYSMADGFKSQMTYYYITYNMGRLDLLPVIILAGLISPLAVQPIIPKLLHFIRKESLIIIGLFASSCASLLMLAAGYRPFPLLVCVVLYGVFTAIVANLVFTVLASFSDEIRMQKNMNISEILTVALDLSATLGVAVASITAPMAMAAFGYSALAVFQTAGTLTGIRVLYILCTAGGLLLSGTIMLLFRKHQRLNASFSSSK